MGLFEKLGRRVGEFTAQAKAAAAEVDGDYRCEACETDLDADHETCPACGADAVVRADDT